MACSCCPLVSGSFSVVVVLASLAPVVLLVMMLLVILICVVLLSSSLLVELHFSFVVCLFPVIVTSFRTLSTTRRREGSSTAQKGEEQTAPPKSGNQYHANEERDSNAAQSVRGECGTTLIGGGRTAAVPPPPKGGREKAAPSTCFLHSRLAVARVFFRIVFSAVDPWMSLTVVPKRRRARRLRVLLRHGRMAIILVLAECCSFAPWGQSAARTRVTGDEMEKKQVQDGVKLTRLIG